jgi:hypothetical protein
MMKMLMTDILFIGAEYAEAHCKWFIEVHVGGPLGFLPPKHHQDCLSLLSSSSYDLGPSAHHHMEPHMQSHVTAPLQLCTPAQGLAAHTSSPGRIHCRVCPSTCRKHRPACHMLFAPKPQPEAKSASTLHSTP